MKSRPSRSNPVPRQDRIAVRAGVDPPRHCQFQTAPVKPGWGPVLFELRPPPLDCDPRVACCNMSTQRFADAHKFWRVEAITLLQLAAPDTLREGKRINC